MESSALNRIFKSPVYIIFHYLGEYFEIIIRASSLLILIGIIRSINMGSPKIETDHNVTCCHLSLCCVSYCLILVLLCNI